MKILNNQKGQSLVEYLIIVAIVAVGSMVAVRVVGQNINGQFAQISKSISGKAGPVPLEEVNANDLKKKDMSNFMSGAK